MYIFEIFSVILCHSSLCGVLFSTSAVIYKGKQKKGEKRNVKSSHDSIKMPVMANPQTDNQCYYKNMKKFLLRI